MGIVIFSGYRHGIVQANFTEQFSSAGFFLQMPSQRHHQVSDTMFVILNKIFNLCLLLFLVVFFFLRMNNTLDAAEYEMVIFRLSLAQRVAVISHLTLKKWMQ